jgi:hypothetical protein
VLDSLSHVEEWRYTLISTILNLCTRWRIVVSFTPLPLNLRGNSPQYHWIGGWVDPMYVCIRGGLLQPLHLDPQWSIVLNPDDR